MLRGADSAIGLASRLSEKNIEPSALFYNGTAHDSYFMLLQSCRAHISFISGTSNPEDRLPGKSLFL